MSAASSDHLPDLVAEALHRGTATDETAMAEARHRAEAAEGILRRVFETSQDLILVTDRNGTFIRVSPSAMLVLGYDPDEMVGRSAVEFLYPDDLDSTRNEMRMARRGGTTQNFECRYVHKCGHLVTLWWKGAWSAPEQQYFFVGRDITELKAAEEALRESEQAARGIVASALDAVIQMDETGTITEWNSQAEAVFGWSRDEALGRRLSGLVIPPGNRARHEAGLARFLATGQPTVIGKRFAIDALRKDGREVRVELAITALRRGKGYVFNGFVRDLSQQIVIEGQLRQSQKMEAIGNLTGGMAHDFNNLLGIIVGNLDLARERAGSDAELQEIIGEALEAALRGADLTRRLLAFARRQPLRPARIEVNELVSDTVRLLRRLLGEDIEVSLELAEKTWPVTVDPAQLEASLANLATNARDAMPKGGRLIITTANRRLDADYAALHADVTEGDFVMIEVSDTGIGMSEEIVSRIFEPFFTTKEPGKGTGLGLSMVFGFLRQSGGHVNVYSEPSVGTTFRLYLPRMVTAGLPREIAEAQVVEPATGEIVLVVEDNSAMRRVTLRQLRELGYRVLECDRAAAALELLQREPVDLLFTDIVMPGGLDGIALARMAAERWPSLKIVLTSGFPQARVDGNGELLGNLQLLSKPYRRTELAAALRSALNP